MEGTHRDEVKLVRAPTARMALSMRDAEAVASKSCEARKTSVYSISGGLRVLRKRKAKVFNATS